MKQFICSICLITILFSNNMTTYALLNKPEIQKNINNEQHEEQQLIISFLIPYIQKAIEDYYGEPKLFWKTEIINIKNLSPGGYLSFMIKVKVETFTGPHNPPFGTEILTFKKTDQKITLVNYKHQD